MLVLLIFILYNSATHVRPLWKFVHRAGVRLQLKYRGQDYNHNSNISDNFPVTKDIFGDKGRESWELKRDNVAVFAIQGRRPHMEDRFNVITDLDDTRTSVYGIFDGHGGEVFIYFFTF